MRDERRSYVLVGAFVILMVAALVIWIAVLSGRGLGDRQYFVVYRDVLGLAEGTQILYEGYPIGQITGIEPTERDGQTVFRVELGIHRDWNLPEDSVAAIAAPGLLSAVVIDIEGGKSTVMLEPGSEIRGREAASIFAAVNDVAAELTEISEQNLKPLLDALGRGTPEIVANVEQFTKALNLTLERIDALLSPGNVQRIDRILVNLETTSSNFAAVAGDLSRTRAEIDTLLRNVDRLLDRNQGEIGHAISDLHDSLEAVSRHIDAISANLEQSTRNLNEFSRQIRENPGLLVRGREIAPDTDGADGGRR
jgi:phospholipid/cholesterol/gamma-HCH transport system substrate-binding protein